MAAGDPVDVDEHRRRRTDQRVARAGGDGILALAEFAQPIADECLVDRGMDRRPWSARYS